MTIFVCRAQGVPANCEPVKVALIALSLLPPDLRHCLLVAPKQLDPQDYSTAEENHELGQHLLDRKMAGQVELVGLLPRVRTVMTLMIPSRNYQSFFSVKAGNAPQWDAAVIMERYFADSFSRH